ncbi:MAG: hypothetical protein AAF611_16695 [Bacteroidota bacterium]
MRTIKIQYFYGIAILAIICITSCKQNTNEQKLIPIADTFSSDAEYIDPATAMLSDGFKVCDEEYILQYYNPERATYSKGKNGLRNYITSNYTNNNYPDSGYLNIRFVINCNGEAGRYVIHENDLNLEPMTFTKELKEQLFTLTTELKEWNPNYAHGALRDSYMYISYRIEHGNITEILP